MGRSRIAKCVYILCFFLAVLIAALGLMLLQHEDGRSSTASQHHLVLRQRVAEEVADVIRFLRHEENGSTEDAVSKLKNIATLLDPRVHGTKEEPHRTTRTKKKKKRSVKERAPMSDLVTVVINIIDFNDYRVLRFDSLINEIEAHYPNLPLIITAVNDLWTSKLTSRYSNVQVLTFMESVPLGEILNALVEEVRTPYMLLAIDMAHLNKHSGLERQVSILRSDRSLGATGGATRNLTGHWSMGCFQNDILNYFLRFQKGYSYASESCMYCDHLQGPLLVKTSVVRKVPFSEEVSHEVMLVDWFLRLKFSNIYVLGCPEVMYQTYTSPEWSANREHWKQIAQQWEVQGISSPTGDEFRFSCEEMKISCDPFKWVHSYLLPACCDAQAHDVMRLFESFSEEHNVTYRIGSGTMLSSVKLRSFAPWDIDADIDFLGDDYRIFYWYSRVFTSKGFPMQFVYAPHNDGNSLIKLWTPDIFVEMYSRKQIWPSLRPEELKDSPTRTEFHGLWLKASENPGLYCLDVYRAGYLRHAQSWRFLNMSSSSASYAGAHWTVCSTPYHHACLDQYPSDGNEIFFSR